MRKFREQLEEKTRMLQAEIRSLQDALEMMKEQLRRTEDSGFQIRGQFHVSKRQKGEEKGTLVVFKELVGPASSDSSCSRMAWDIWSGIQQ